MTKGEIIKAFAELGIIMADAASDSPFSSEAKWLRERMDDQYLSNKWFTPGNVRFAVKSLSHMISRDNLEKWFNIYDIQSIRRTPLTVALVMAGNIPLVGFHDLLCVLASGNMALVKTSSKDPGLTMNITEILGRINPLFSNRINFSGEALSDYNAMIATGSDNSRRYFEYYFGSKPHLFRSNRSSLGLVVTGTTDEELRLLGRDIFSYFGLGCRNVSKLLVNRDFDTDRLTELWSGYRYLSEHQGWSNNYRYNRALFNINGVKFTDGRSFLLTENSSLFPPLSVIHYQYYDNPSDATSDIASGANKIQCITGPGYIPYGKSQQPELWDYADNIDTIRFLLTI
ncbi:MAG: acyl-CoA reductase [Bacteroidia bacterium]|nr:MAG: acyl-CoA reductase [Bacteroidia bacterium]